jgi:hypothetical protein
LTKIKRRTPEKASPIFLDHIEPMFSDNLHAQLKLGILLHVLCITLLQLFVVVNPINTCHAITNFTQNTYHPRITYCYLY